MCGSDFELKLRNQLTQKAIARECVEWIKRKVQFKSNSANTFIQGLLNVERNGGNACYYPFTEFTTIGIGCERGNNAFNFVQKLDAPQSQQLLSVFNSLWNDETKMQDVTAVVIDNLTAAYRENSPEFIYYITIYNIFHEFLSDISEDVLPNEGVGFRNSKIWNLLYDFQKDAVLAIINKLTINRAYVITMEKVKTDKCRNEDERHAMMAAELKTGLVKAVKSYIAEIKRKYPDFRLTEKEAAELMKEIRATLKTGLAKLTQ